ncbi:hypothetical protein HD806DRAFT_498727 [Xylariaceae sp. AK1471]|nr:hypothetical protein HD806DRAFT_498727 [Xylariaceae sp. AK1471]
MHAKTLGAIVACFVGFLGMAMASGGVIDNSVSTTHIHHHRSLNHRHASLMKYDIQQEENLMQPPDGPVYRCHDPHPEIFGPAPPVEDCDDVIKQFAALPTDINVKLVEGCYQIVSGNCSGLVCPQRVGESTIPGSVAAQYMASPLRDECIAKGQRGWWIDGQGWGVGVYLA